MLLRFSKADFSIEMCSSLAESSDSFFSLSVSLAYTCQRTI